MKAQAMAAIHQRGLTRNRIAAQATMAMLAARLVERLTAP